MSMDLSSARNKLGDVLLNLVLKREDSPIASDDESKPPIDSTLQSLSSPATSPSKRQSGSGRSARKKRKKETAIREGTGYHHTYVMKLFDRSVDLAQFSEDTPLYPICRAWMKNDPDNRNLYPKQEDVQDTIVNPGIGDEFQMNVYRLPPPVPPNPEKTHYSNRIPTPLPKENVQNGEIVISSDLNTAPPIDRLLLNHLHRWKSIRESWKAKIEENEERYVESTTILKSMFQETHPQ